MCVCLCKTAMIVVLIGARCRDHQRWSEMTGWLSWWWRICLAGCDGANHYISADFTSFHSIGSDTHVLAGLCNVQCALGNMQDPKLHKVHMSPVTPLSLPLTGVHLIGSVALRIPFSAQPAFKHLSSHSPILTCNDMQCIPSDGETNSTLSISFQITAI